MTKNISITCDVHLFPNGKKIVNSKLCENITDAFLDLQNKILKINETYEVVTCYMCASTKVNKEKLLASHFHDELRLLLQDCLLSSKSINSVVRDWGLS